MSISYSDCEHNDQTFVTSFVKPEECCCKPCDIQTVGFTYNTQTGQFANTTTAGTGTTILGWSWNFGDPASGTNNISALQNPVHNFSAPGTYHVCLYVFAKNNCGISCCEMFCLDIIIPESICSIQSGYTYTYQFLPGNKVQYNFTATPVLNPTAPPASVQYTWTFGDPTSGALNTLVTSSSTATHIYNSCPFLPLWKKCPATVCLHIQLTTPEGNICSSDTCFNISLKKIIVLDTVVLPPHFRYTIKAYPNPAQEKVTFQIEGGDAENMTLEIYDMMGTKLWTNPISATHSSFDVDVSHFIDGTYLYMLKVDDVVVNSDKLLIIR
ncbi:MAG: PKD domain-containing protein [Chitinophagales bacterium]|nr:PKD domain-containing protein [Chitinophagales bacterium]